MPRTPLNTHFDHTSFLYGGNAAYLEKLHEAYAQDPLSVEPEWRNFFAQYADPSTTPRKQTTLPSSPQPEWVLALDGSWDALDTQPPSASSKPRAKASQTQEKQGQLPPLDMAEFSKRAEETVRALALIQAYRTRGHLIANLDPLSLRLPQAHPDLDPRTYGFEPEDMDRPIFLDRTLGFEQGTLREVLARLHQSYCGTLGAEFMHISNPTQKQWLQDRIEGVDRSAFFSREDRLAILEKLIESEKFEHFLHVKYTGTKRFGLDGGESVIPALEQVVKTSAALGVEEIVLGMAHRGRLNVLANIMGKPYQVIFHEFKGGSSTPEEVEGSGDVKYHLGSSSDRWFGDRKLHLSLTANPSHLEIVDPVVLGKVRAKQDQRGKDRGAVLPILIHGDAAFAGQGVVAECFGLSGLKGHRTGGSIHVIVNNQIGFTTSPIWARSSPYPSDVAKMIDAPIFHVNGDDPEAVVYAATLAMEFRQTFATPVVIDLFCYRRFGHNETDEPSFTQPLMYREIADHPTVLEIYRKKLQTMGVLSEEDADGMEAKFRRVLDDALAQSEEYHSNKADWLDGRWTGLKPPSTSRDNEEEPTPTPSQTGVAKERLKEIGLSVTTLPDDFAPHKTLVRVMKARRNSIEAGEGIDWATAEALAFGTLLGEGFSVRLSGQDVQRGTFSQRHAVVIDQETERSLTPLNHLWPDQKAQIEVINSMLSEEAVLGFEYGYSLAEPNVLVLWEAQFGDFANGAQVIFDQFLSSGERKWLRMSGLVCLLPHGYEGQGPEHSSARLERFLQMCAEDNMQVANCSTPANYFHILRRQLHRPFRKPLILMTPKSLLRHKRCVSTFEEMSQETGFQRVLRDGSDGNLVADNEIRRVILCSGRVYYDLLEERERVGATDVYLLRLEQFYPFPFKALITELGRFPKAEVAWCQEEPYNMGAWSFVQTNLEWVLGKLDGISKRPRYIGRSPSASTAVGLMGKHMRELQAFLDEAFAS